MAMISIEDAQARLPEVIDQLKPGEDILITRDNKPLARLTLPGPVEKPLRRLGTLKGTVRYVAPDFDAPLEEFKEYAE